MQAIESRYGPQCINRIVITRTRVGAVYADESHASFVQWCSEAEAGRTFIPWQQG
jgi:hypothetical protein